MPILGIMASAMSGNLWQPAGAYDSLATVTLSAATSSITFAGIPSTYKHLQIRGIVRNTGTNPPYYALVQFNGDTTSSYTRHNLYGNGASAAANGSASATTSGMASVTSGANLTAGMFNGFVTDILDYTNTNKYKTVRALSGYDANGSGVVYLSSSVWLSTSAVSSLVIIPEANNFEQYSSFALYGIN